MTTKENYVPDSFETNGFEGVRKAYPTGEPYFDFDGDLRRYEDARRDSIYGQHISYARSIAKNIADGMSLEQVVSILSVEIIHFNMDIPQTVQLANYFLEEYGREERLDHFLNITKHDELVVHSGITTEKMTEYSFARVARDTEECEQLVKAAARHMAGPTVHDYIIEFIKGDLMQGYIDNVAFANRLNEELEQMGVAHRFNQYLEQVDI
jgi:hypothetical protein